MVQTTFLFSLPNGCPGLRKLKQSVRFFMRYRILLCVWREWGHSSSSVPEHRHRVIWRWWRNHSYQSPAGGDDAGVCHVGFYLSLASVRVCLYCAELCGFELSGSARFCACFSFPCTQPREGVLIRMDQDQGLFIGPQDKAMEFQCH